MLFLLLRGLVPLNKENSCLKWCLNQSVINWSVLQNMLEFRVKPSVCIFLIPQVCQLFWALLQEVSDIVKTLIVGNAKSIETDFSQPSSSCLGNSGCSGLPELRRQIREASCLVSSCWACIANCKPGCLVCLLMFKNRKARQASFL